MVFVEGVSQDIEWVENAQLTFLLSHRYRIGVRNLLRTKSVWHLRELYRLLTLLQHSQCTQLQSSKKTVLEICNAVCKKS
jgi:hypothetical protein